MVARVRHIDHGGATEGNEVHRSGGERGGENPRAGDDGAAHCRGGLPVDRIIHDTKGDHRVPIGVRVIVPGISRPGEVRAGAVHGAPPRGPFVQEKLSGIRSRGPPVRGAEVRHQPPGLIHRNVHIASRFQEAQNGWLR